MMKNRNEAADTTPLEDSEGRRGEAPVGPQLSAGGVNACPSNTHSLNSHLDARPQETLKTKHSLPSAIAAVDWFEVGGRVSWDEDDSLYEFQKLEDVFRRAQDQHCPEPWTIDGKTVLVHPGGLGSGRQSRMRYRIDWGPLLIGVSDRPSDSRLLSNFYLKASGEVCLLFGLKAVLEFQDALVRAQGGRLTDSWIKRIDLCLDLPGMAIGDQLIPAYLQDRFITSSSSWGAYAGPSGATGFTFGSKSGVRLNVYDKLHEVRSKGPDYQQAMVQYRWGNSWPDAAIRVEYQIRKPWLDQLGILSAKDGLERLGDIITKVTAEGPRPFLRFTSTVPDRTHGHQGRAETLPVWGEIIQAFRTGFPDGIKPLARLNRGSITRSRAFSFIRGYLTKSAAIGGLMIHGLEDAIDVLRDLHQGNWSTDEEWKEAWEQHAMKLGTIDTAHKVGGENHES